jgi:hypothetical protein
MFGLRRFSSARVKKWKFKFELSAANTMRFVPVNFGETECAVNQTDTRDSLALAPSALPVPLAQARRSRTPLPLAIVSVEIISPTISKSIPGHTLSEQQSAPSFRRCFEIRGTWKKS